MRLFVSRDTWGRQKSSVGQGSLLAVTLGGDRKLLGTRLFVSRDTWGKQKSSLGQGSLLASTLGVDRKAPWDEALC